jgi:transposase
MEKRRKRAARMFERGVTQADVAQELEVSRQSVSRWYADWQRGGTRALNAAGRAGRMPRLTAAQLGRVERALRRGPRAHGFATDLWTLDRVATVIETETGVRYHRGHVWKLLHDKLGWSRQRPARRAVERDDEAIARWVAEDWPRIKRGLVDAERGSSSRTNRGSRSSRR